MDTNTRVNDNRILVVHCDGPMTTVSLFVGGVRMDCVTFSGAVPLEEIAEMARGVSALACPGGVLRPVRKGVYRLTDDALRDAADPSYGTYIYDRLMQESHVIADALGIPAYMLYPMTSDELTQELRVGSLADIPVHCRYFALEHAAAVQMAAQTEGADASEKNYIVVYAADYVSVGAHRGGECISVNDAIGLEGPMGLTASGDVPSLVLAELIGSGDDSLPAGEAAVRELLTSGSGLTSYAGTPDADAAVSAMAYQIAKWIGGSTMALGGKVDAIILAGRALDNEELLDMIIDYAGRIADCIVLPDLDAGQFMADTCEAVLAGTVPVYDYRGEI